MVFPSRALSRRARVVSSVAFSTPLLPTRAWVGAQGLGWVARGLLGQPPHDITVARYVLWLVEDTSFTQYDPYTGEG